MTCTKQPSLDTPPPTRPSPQVSEWLARLPLIDDDNSTKSRAFKNNTTEKNKSGTALVSQVSVIDITWTLFSWN